MGKIEQQMGSDFSKLVDGLSKGKYRALLGAGASASSVDRHGVPLPGGEQLRKEIVRLFNLPGDSTPNLRRVFSQAKLERTDAGMSLPEYMRDRFTQTTPSPWLGRLLEIPWASIWSLNVDDCIERAHNANEPNNTRNLHSISWQEPFRQSQYNPDSLLLIHLHGKASRVKQDDLVFDISSYVKSSESKHRWLRVFGDEFPVAPFVVLGASLDEEYDLESILREKTSDPELPSIIVLKSISEFQRREYRDFGLIPIEATGEEFVKEVLSSVRESITKMLPAEVLKREGSNPRVIKFLEQWQLLDKSNFGVHERTHDFYAGHEPRWGDAVKQRISKRDIATDVVTAARNASREGRFRISVLIGGAFSGKSSLGLYCARALGDAGLRPYLYRGESAIDMEAVSHWMTLMPNTVLIVDDAADFAQDFESLLNQESEALALNVILIERLSRSKHIKATLVDEIRVREIKVSDQLSRVEISHLIKTLSDNHRLGQLTDVDERTRTEYFLSRDRKLFSGMAELEGGRGFASRVIDEFESIIDQDANRLLKVVSLGSNLGYPLPLEISNASIGLTPREAQTIAENHLVDLLHVGQGRISTRHRVFGELMLSHMKLEAKFSAIVNLGRAVAPHVTRDSISNSTIFYRIARTLLGHQKLFELLDSDVEKVLEVYENLELEYDWNARYWEQRALAASKANFHERSYSWAYQAIAKRRDAYSLNTIAVVLLNRAMSEAQGGKWPSDSFDQAVEFLAEARKLEGSHAFSPVSTFFSYTNRLLEAARPSDPQILRQVADLWKTWNRSMLALDSSFANQFDSAVRTAVDGWEVHGLGMV